MIKGIMISAIIPAHNEEKTVGNVINVLKEAGVGEIIVVDDGSTDNTPKIAESLQAKVIRQKKKSGKGAAIKKGIKSAKGEILLFVDADLTGLDHKKIVNLLTPVAKGKADFVKGYGYFNVNKALEKESMNISKQVVDPLFKAYFPELNIIDSLSGQWCAKKDFLLKAEIPDDYGADVSVLLDAYQQNLRIAQENLGYVEHNASKDPAKEKERKQRMAEEISKAIKKKIGIK
jgi:glycosyltransferase involved in cell wall biosynthesis